LSETSPRSPAEFRKSLMVFRVGQGTRDVILTKSWYIIVHMMLLCLNLIIVSLYGENLFMSKNIQDSVYSSNSLRNSMKYEERLFMNRPIYKAGGEINDHQPTAFNGPPRPELEDEWARLMKYENVRVTREELGEFAGDDSIAKLTDGSGYYVTVAAFHGLHCVRNLHKYIYADHYYEGYSEHNISAVPQATDSGHHYCVDWHQFDEWMERHSFDPLEPGLLVHPHFGEAYMNDTGVKLGLGVEDLGEGASSGGQRGGVLH
ncbi:hypothetical protein CI238_07372, partial [Colletotrichum incanum]